MITTRRHKVQEIMRLHDFEPHYVTHTLKHLKREKVDITLLMLVLLVAIIGSIFIFTGMVPIIAEQSLLVVLLCFIVTGSVFGYFIQGMLQEQYLTLTHYIILSTGFFVISSLCMLMVLAFFKFVLVQYGYFFHDQPILYLVFYFVSFSLPHVLWWNHELG